MFSFNRRLVASSFVINDKLSTLYGRDSPTASFQMEQKCLLNTPHFAAVSFVWTMSRQVCIWGKWYLFLVFEVSDVVLPHVQYPSCFTFTEIASGNHSLQFCSEGFNFLCVLEEEPGVCVCLQYAIISV